MVLRRTIALAALLALPACKQSLFDAHGDSDARPGDGDGDGDGDALPPDSCPATCIADLVADYDGTPAGSSGVWRYLSDARDGTVTPMTAGQWNGIDGLVGGGADPVPALIDCRAHASEPACAGVADRILLVPSQASAGHHDPAVEVSIDSAQQYRVSGVFSSTTSDSVVHDLRIYRNSLADLLHGDVFDIDNTQRGYSVDAELVAGDRLLLSLRPESGTGTPIGVQHYVSRNTGAFPGRCGVTVRFEDISGADVTDDCGLITFKARADDGAGGYMDLTPVPTATGPTGMGTAIALAEGQYLLPTGSPMDYAGDFTIQMWVRIVDFNFTTMSLWADWHDTAEGGVSLAIDSGGTFYAEVLTPGAGDVPLSFAWPTDQAWHFIRVVRDTGASTFRVCLDAEQKGSATLSGTLNLSTDEPPYIGRNVDYNPPYFQGELDDVRMFTRALPCP
ncbi:MAG TPA: LamG domain-containing protein [Kofleriaceae bacterium]|nr:LamG domain-containing protein [Kofleriaceae bacterium]